MSDDAESTTPPWFTRARVAASKPKPTTTHATSDQALAGRI
jgi:hypothetical protein